MNIQPIIKQDLRNDGKIRLHHMFSTIQGEGPFVGVPAVFLRLAGCNLQCPLCDTDYTSQESLVTPDEILKRVYKLTSPSKLIVITGGEPFTQNLAPLVNALFDHGFSIQIETNGTLFLHDFPYEKVTIVCSPKAGKVSGLLSNYIHSYKYVLHADSLAADDGLPLLALDHPAAPRVARPHRGFIGRVYVQPVDVGEPLGTPESSRHLQAAIASCLKYGYTLGLQTHKLINME